VIGGTKPGRGVCARAGYRLAERSEGARLAGSGSNAVTERCGGDCDRAKYGHDFKKCAQDCAHVPDWNTNNQETARFCAGSLVSCPGNT
jgi:hypothetical protein